MLRSALALALATIGAGPPATIGAGPPAKDLPPIVFVSRQPVPGEARAVPGLGPHHRAIVTGGRLLLRERDGRVRELLPPGAFVDVSDPTVSPDGRRIAFAGVSRHDGPWRIWVLGADGGPRPVTLDPGDSARVDDLDPCWLDDTSLVFASTRYPQRAQYADLPVTNLFTTCVAPTPGRHCPPRRVTAERNGAEEPALDARTGRLLFARWWFNRYRAADSPAGITAEPGGGVARDTVNLWQVMEITPSDHRARLAGGDLGSRRGTMGYQPSALADGGIAAVYAANLGLSPRPGGTGIHRFSPAFGGGARLVGALVAARAGDVYAGAEGLAPPSACAPAGLADGRVLFSYDPGARGEFGLYVMRGDGSRIERVIDLPGTLELDAAPVVARPGIPRGPAPAVEEREDPEGYARALAAGRIPVDEHTPVAAPPDDPRWFASPAATFRFHNLDVFADGPAGSPARGAAPRTPGTRIRFFATVPRPEREGGDSAVLVREVPVGANGEVNERGLPADIPMFEQLVGPDGRVLMTAHGPAHVAGFNAGVAGNASRCVGCHLGHSTLPLGTASAPPAGGRR